MVLIKDKDSMRESDKSIKIGLKTLNEVEALNSCVAKYFKDKLESLSLNEDESLILSALTVYFRGVQK